MVILLVRSGQLCNRLFSIAAFVGNSIENNYPLVCTSFDDYYNKFDDLNRSAGKYNIQFLTSGDGTQRLRLKLFYKVISKFPKVGNVTRYSAYTTGGDINTPTFINKAIKKKLFVQGWPYWDVENFIKHSKEIREIFTPQQHYFEKVSAFINAIDAEYDVLIGVHVRKGDYKYFADGIYYFSKETYIQKMDEIFLQLKALGKKPAFIICSNEKFEINTKVDFYYKVSSLDDVSDLILLSKCDYIFGPPSTYSMWASFYGQVPYNNFFSANEKMNIEDFSHIIAPSKFANGRQIVDVYEKYIS